MNSAVSDYLKELYNENMNSTVSDYLEELYNDPIGIEEYKIKMLKSYFYPKITLILNCNLDNFKIGVTKNKDLIWFISDENPNTEILYYHVNDKYFINNKLNKERREIYIEDYMIKKSENNNIREINFSVCIII